MSVHDVPTERRPAEPSADAEPAPSGSGPVGSGSVPPDTGERGAARTPGGFVRANRVSLVAGAVAVVLAAIVWFGMPHERDLTSVWVLLFKLTPFVAGSVAIAWMDVAWARRLRLHLVGPPVCFLVFFCYFVPKIFFYSGQEDGFAELYYHVLTLTPFVILSLVFAYRLGGGSSGTVMRLAVAMILLQLSGLEDLAFLTVNDHTDPRWATIPEVWTWADHMTVFFGQPLTKNQAFAFIAVHVVLALAVLFTPGRVVRRLVRR